MKVNDNVVKDLAYQEMIYNKLLEQDSRFAALFPYTNISHDILQGGTRVRKHPLPGIAMNTYEPSTLAVGNSTLTVGGKNNNLHLKKEEIHILPYKKEIKITGGSSNNRIEIVKKIMKEKGLTLPQASKFVKENNLYQKIEKAVGAGNKSGRISRIKKANKWKNFSKEVVEDGMELGQKGLDMFNKQKDRQSPMGQVKRAFGAGNKSGRISRIKKANKWKDFSKEVVEDGMELGQKGLDMFNKQKDRNSPMGQMKRAFGGVVKAPSKWIMFVKEFASKNGISYKEALKAAGPEYRKSKEN
jgi:L,D-peptidoglycan transpeptidase YkuD (ErfK/YbiS/YcfS/YnhG family)